MLTPETAAELKAFMAGRGIMEYIFPSPKRAGPRCRTWPNSVLAKHGAEGISPRTFRRTGATRWNDRHRLVDGPGRMEGPEDDLPALLEERPEWHVTAFEQAMNVRMSVDDGDDVPGYR